MDIPTVVFVVLIGAIAQILTALVIFGNGVFVIGV